MLHFTQEKMGGDTYTVSARMSREHDANMVILWTAQTDSSNTVVGTKFTRPKDGTIQSSVFARLTYRVRGAMYRPTHRLSAC